MTIINKIERESKAHELMKKAFEQKFILNESQGFESMLRKKTAELMSKSLSYTFVFSYNNFTKIK